MTKHGKELEPDRPRADGTLEFDLGSRILARHFADEEFEPEEEETPVFIFTLAELNSLGVRQLARKLWQEKALENGEFTPAKPNVISEHLYYRLKTSPPKAVINIGSIDEQLIDQARLSENGYIEEIRDLIAFADPDAPFIDVLEFPKYRQKITEAALDGIEKAIIVRTLKEHGIKWLIDEADTKAWNRLRLLAESLADEGNQTFAGYLRDKKDDGGMYWEDAQKTLDDITAIRHRAAELAKANLCRPIPEIRRMLEGNQNIRTALLQAFEYLDPNLYSKLVNNPVDAQPPTEEGLIIEEAQEQRVDHEIPPPEANAT